MIECTRMFSETPGSPGRRQQMPRTIRSMCTPAIEARYRARMISGSTSALTLTMMCPVPPAGHVVDLVEISSWSRSERVNGEWYRRFSGGIFIRLVSCRNSSCTSSPISSSAVSRP
jgi:hypothetical protein